MASVCQMIIYNRVIIIIINIIIVGFIIINILTNLKNQIHTLHFTKLYYIILF